MLSTKPDRSGSYPSPPRTSASAADWPALAHRDLVRRVVVSPTFARSERLIALLTYVCDMALQGRSAEISEQKIGCEVFGRSEDYDSAIDGIVRTQASRLRQRLDLYFQQEGASEPVHIVIPRGGYTPLFVARSEVETVPPSDGFSLLSAPVAEPVAPVPSAPRGRILRTRVAALLLALAAVVAILLALNLATSPGRLDERLMAAIHPSPSQRLWQTLLTPGRPTLLVVGDAGANMFENISRSTITPDAYSTDSWSKEPEAQTPPGYNWVPIARRTYTPFFAARFAARVARLPQVSDGQLSVVFARSLRLDELKQSQAILLGGLNYDPWEELLAGSRNFRYSYDPKENSVTISNEHPESSEAAVYKWKQSDPNPVAGYALITLTHNLSGTGRILLLQGTTAQGDEEAADFILNETALNPLLAGAIASDGKIEDFEALLETRFVGGGSVGARVAAFRVHPSR